MSIKYIFCVLFATICMKTVIGSHDGSSDCEIYSESNFQNDPLIPMKDLDNIYDFSLLATNNSKSFKSIKIHHDCGLLICTLPKFKGDCQEHFISEENLSSTQNVNFQSAMCKCSSKDKKSERSECAVLSEEWFFTGESQQILFAGSSDKIKLSNIKSVRVKSNCSVLLWKNSKENKIASLSLDNSTTLLSKGDQNYEWYCCQCNSLSESVCKSAQDSTLLISDESTKVDFSKFVKHGKKIIGIGRNYRWKKSELAKVLKEPENPIVFLKPSTSYIEEGEQIKLPQSLGTIFYEIELGVVIGKTGKSIAKSNALDHVAGYFLALDMTAKEFLKKSINQSLPWEIGKGFDTACPVSHFIPKNLIPNPNDIHLLCKVNGNVTQSENTSQMIFDVPTLISYISKYMTLEPNDVILTGTPDGLGPIYDGDVIEGTLGNYTSIRFEAVSFDDSIIEK